MTPKEKFTCDFCGKDTFKNKRALSSHKVLAHKWNSNIAVPAFTKPDTEAETVLVKKPQIVLSKKAGRPWQFMLLGVSLIVLGAAATWLWFVAGRQMYLAVLIVLAVFGGGYSIYHFFESNNGGSPNAVFIPEYNSERTGQSKDVLPAGPLGEQNCLNIYAQKGDDGKVYPQKIAFEYMKHPVGQLQQCTNDGKWYHVQIWDIGKERLKPFLLPDSQYFDPREFANVIKMPAHRKLFEKHPSLLQKIAPAIMLLACIIMGFVLIAVNG